MVNIDLLARTNDHIRKFPALHNQGAWAEGVALPSFGWDERAAQTEADLTAGEVCGTAFCFAGWAALLAGWHQCRGNYEEQVVDETGRTLHMQEAAAESLGLTVAQAGKLFDGANDQEVIDRYVAHLTAHPDASVDDLDAVEDDYIDEVA